MRVHLCAVGRLRKGPERALISDYLGRFGRIGRQLALGPCLEHEVDERKASSMSAQAQALTRVVPDGATVIALDERGDGLNSRDLALYLARLRDAGQSDVAFVIGGADGLDPEFRATAQRRISLGTMVWPHMLVRVMLAEQLYRAATILSGSPYHRD